MRPVPFGAITDTGSVPIHDSRKQLSEKSDMRQSEKANALPSANLKRREFPPFLFKKGNIKKIFKNILEQGFPGGSVANNLPHNAGDTGLDPSI